VLRYLHEVRRKTLHRIVFLEETLGPANTADYTLLRQKCDVPLCGGETLTTAADLCELIRNNVYDFVQPDATVVGGIGEVLKVFDCSRQAGRETVVHCWSGAVGLMANYHAAFAGGARLVEWPMPEFSLRTQLLIESLQIVNGKIDPPTQPGLGVQLTEEIEEKYPFREEATYRRIACECRWPPPELWQV
jgi:L-alanine-DL-glutamate epimerase-like enolase superfamily enzyme